MRGTVKKWLEDRGFGFIRPADGGPDVFVHQRNLIGAAMLEQGELVEFEVAPSARVPGKNEAINVTVR